MSSITPELEVFDPRFLVQLQALLGAQATETIRRLFGVFQEQTPDLIEAIDEGLRAGDAAKVARAAHVLKGSCSQLGLGAMQAAAADLEATALRGDLDDAAGLLLHVERELPRAKRAIDELEVGGLSS